MTSSRDSRKRKLRVVDLLSLQNQPNKSKQIQTNPNQLFTADSTQMADFDVASSSRLKRVFRLADDRSTLHRSLPENHSRSKEANYVHSKISTDSWIKRGNVFSDGCSDLRTSLMTKAGALFN